MGKTVPGRARTLAVLAIHNRHRRRLADAFAPDVGSLYRKYAAKVGRWAARLGGPSIEVDDVVQEVFLVAKRRLGSFRSDGGGSVTTWLFRATDRIVKATRRKQRLRRLFGASADARRGRRRPVLGRFPATSSRAGKRSRACTACWIACPSGSDAC